jgi:hypothetical protein
VSSNAATLNGSINPNGADTSWYFEYGTSTSYGSKTPKQDAGAGTSAVPVSASISGLQGSRTYHYRLVASSAGGTSTGADVTFSTGSAPGVATTAASSIAATSARLNGTVNPNGQSTSWYFEYGSSTAYGLKTPSHSAGSGTKAVGESASVGSLLAGTTYHFRLVATNGSGTSYGTDVSFVTLGVPVAQASAAQSVAPTTAVLTGSVDPKGRSTSWYFDYGPTTAYGSKTPRQTIGAGSGATPVSVTVSSLTPSTTYHFRLVATSSAGTATSSDVSFATPAALTMDRPALRVVAGGYVRLSGSVWGSQPGVKVTVLAQPFGEATLTPVATALTGAGGLWTQLVQPRIATAYQATANGGSTATMTVGVQPAVELHVLSHGRFLTRVSAASPFAGKIVQLQRSSYGRWVTVARARLSSRSTAVFSAKVLPRGHSTVRIAFSVNQAGPGYLAGFSRTVGYRR